MLILLLQLLQLLLPGWMPADAPRLAGRWQQRETSFVARNGLTAAQQEQLNDSLTADLNTQLRKGQATMTLTLDPAGNYRYARQAKRAAGSAVAGTWHLSRDTLYLRAQTASPALPPMLRVVRLTRRVLVLEFPIWKPADQVYQQVRFRRF